MRLLTMCLLRLLLALKMTLMVDGSRIGNTMFLRLHIVLSCKRQSLILLLLLGLILQNVSLLLHPHLLCLSSAAAVALVPIILDLKTHCHHPLQALLWASPRAHLLMRN
uniref:Uncharacterized protein MANES_16G115300 n=1 Tax=Rhizophora mucronata TaxID=61149 RepID=A0A2P2PNW0_RHIMU